MLTFAQAQTPLIFTLDVGSSSSRAMIFDAHGHAIDGLEARSGHALHTTPDGAAEDDADAALQRVAGLIDQVLQLAGDRASDIGAVAMDTYAANRGGVEADGQPITPAYTCADTRAPEDAQRLRQRYEDATVHARSACLVRAR